jgi:multidrug efflux pump subunit AcrB
MKRWIEFFIDKTAWVNGITIAIALSGMVALWGMKRDLHPAFQFNYVQVTVNYPGSSADEIERLVTYPMEEAMRDLSDLEEMKSTTQVGQTRIILKFPHSVKNITEKMEEIRDRVQGQLGLLPEGARDAQVTRLSDNEIFLASIGVSGIDERNWDHHHFIETLKNKILTVNGVSKVESTLKPFHVFVRFDKQKLASHGVTVAQLRTVIHSELNSNVIGFNSVSGKDWLLEYTQTPLDPKVIAALPLYENSQGYGLTIGDVASVSYDLERNDRYHFLLNGKNAVELIINKSPHRDSIDTFADVKAVLDQIQKPAGVSFKVLYDGPYFIQQQINVLVSNGIGGLVLVLVMLALAMGWKSSLMTAIGLPISYFGTFLVLRAFGISIDLISMIAMILVVGNLVDDAVIFAERYNQLLAEGVEPRTAASQSARELIVPVTGTIATIICAFIPIVVIDSELSIIFFAIPVVVAVALLLSWFETFFILPNHLAHFVKTPSAERATVFFHFLARGYKRALQHTLRFRFLYGILSLALLGFSLYTATKMPQDFSIQLNAPQVEVFVTFKEEYSFDHVKEILSPLHTQILQLPQNQLDFIETNLGWVWREGKAYRGPKYATVRLVLNKDEVDVRTLREKVHGEVQNILKTYRPNEIAEIEAVASERGSNARRNNLASIEIRGRDESLFRQAKAEAIAQLSGKKDIGENVPPDDVGPKTYHFKPISSALRSYSISREDLAYQIQAQTGSVELLQTRASGRWMKVMLEPEVLREPSLNELQGLRVQSPKHGDMFGVGQLGSWQLAGFSEGIEHKNGVRVLILDFRFDGNKTNEQVVKQQVKELLDPLARRYPGLEFRAVDANEQDKKGRDWTGKIVLGAAVLIYLILALTLRSWTQPLIVGLPIPFALIGVVWALKFHGLSLGLMAMIGLIGTMGVAVNDSIVMVHHINLLWKEAGQRTAALIVDGATSRLRAIFLTASCTLVGVFPTAYGMGGESGFTQPLAFSMGWGLLASLMLTLFIIPAMLLVFEDIRVWLGRRWSGKAQPPEKMPERVFENPGLKDSPHPSALEYE